ncbi:glycosyltransferase family 2 protein [Cupriavidus taiwanensis]|uniref:glycosyltransferase family 2 protein n=1 Tax=Cupriavidus taiwanensis TaxID=164546 RepID=UPI000E14CB9F|nr:glycosyltransferase family 2 protein [Cupriavidus taiwanensis]SPC11696.1 conserved hypothetical protein [Cupriavidus taiwanensis]
MTKRELTAQWPRVSVVIPCYNQAGYLMESIASAKAAYAGDLEIIVVNDGSTDPHTARQLREVLTYYPEVQVMDQQNAGLSAARNAGIHQATGTYIQLLDADDLLLPGKLTRQVEHFSVASALDVSVSNFLLSDESLISFSKPEEAIAQFNLSIEDFLFKWERGFAIPIHGALFHRRVFDRVLFEVNSRAKEDWQFWCELALNEFRMAYLPLHAAIYRQHGHSMRRSYLNMGRSWIQAVANLDRKVRHTHPLFFEAGMAWFEQCYRSHPSYRSEVAALQASKQAVPAALGPAESGADEPEPEELAERILQDLASLATPSDQLLITVVVPIYNHYGFLRQCLSSLQAQGDVAFEVICVEDHSSDVRVTRLMQALANRLSRLHVITHRENYGITRSQMEAVGLARGAFIAFLDCDDALGEGALGRVAAEIERKPGVDYFFTDRLDVGTDDTVVRHARYGGYDNIQPTGNIRDDLLDGMVASHLKVIRRSAFLAAGGGESSFDGIQDWEIALTVAEAGEFHYIPEALYRHRIHAQSVTTASAISQMRKTNRLRRRFQERWMEAGSDTLVEFVIDDRSAVLNLNEVKAAWRAGRRCILTLSGMPIVPVINAIREFNSYFDRITYTQPEVFAVLIGYVWSPEILQRTSQ